MGVCVPCAAYDCAHHTGTYKVSYSGKKARGTHLATCDHPCKAAGLVIDAQPLPERAMRFVEARWQPHARFPTRGCKHDGQRFDVGDCPFWRGGRR